MKIKLYLKKKSLIIIEVRLWKRMGNTVQVYPLSWVLSNNRLERVDFFFCYLSCYLCHKKSDWCFGDFPLHLWIICLELLCSSLGDRPIFEMVKWMIVLKLEVSRARPSFFIWIREVINRLTKWAFANILNNFAHPVNQTRP